jgi:hypothetical protein
MRTICAPIDFYWRAAGTVLPQKRAGRIFVPGVLGIAFTFAKPQPLEVDRDAIFDFAVRPQEKMPVQVSRGFVLDCFERA